MSAKAAGRSRARRKLSAQDVQASLAENGAVSPFYLLHGEEEYGRLQLYTWLVERLQPPVAAEFNVDTFHADTLEPQRLLDIYFSYPMMAPQRLVVLKGVDKLSPAHTKALEPLVEQTAETSVVLVAGSKIDMRRRLFAQMAKLGQAVEFKIPYDDKLPEAIAAIARDKELQIRPEAIDLLCMYMGPRHLQEVAHELDKLSIYAGAGETIEADHVRQTSGSGRNASIFDLTDAVGNGDVARAQDLLRDLMQQGEEPARMVPMLSRHLQLLLRTQRLEQRRVQRDEMARALGISPFFLPSYRTQARQLAAVALWRGLSALRQADDLIKGGGRGRNRPQVVMDLCLAQLLGRPGSTTTI
ncbi:MAG: DNA polymerase III subunit delta [Gemmatimonadetes bacterium]|nr:DNA polymerase III subunit delta [Gemmatimonadota bacterium]MBT6145291.1 DNA polymerase III subunit delta [Gemmatimonadota bacterium]MBT7863409.1 DNA polymerase III subunit delta [Gemmatimonadota bacterium]